MNKHVGMYEPQIGLFQRLVADPALVETYGAPKLDDRRHPFSIHFGGYFWSPGEMWQFCKGTKHEAVAAALIMGITE